MTEKQVYAMRNECKTMNELFEASPCTYCSFGGACKALKGVERPDTWGYEIPEKILKKLNKLKKW